MSIFQFRIQNTYSFKLMFKQAIMSAKCEYDPKLSETVDTGIENTAKKEELSKLMKSVIIMIPISSNTERRNTLSTSPSENPVIPEQNMNCDFDNK